MRSGWRLARYPASRRLVEGRSASGLFFLGTAVQGDGSLVGGHVAGKLMRAGAIRTQHEIESIGIGRRQHGADGIQTGIGDRARRQDRKSTRVVGRSEEHTSELQ